VGLVRELAALPAALCLRAKEPPWAQNEKYINFEVFIATVRHGAFPICRPVSPTISCGTADKATVTTIVQTLPARVFPIGNSGILLRKGSGMTSCLSLCSLLGASFSSPLIAILLALSRLNPGCPARVLQPTNIVFCVGECLPESAPAWHAAPEWLALIVSPQGAQPAPSPRACIRRKVLKPIPLCLSYR
jgi:hypothetical protein